MGRREGLVSSISAADRVIANILGRPLGRFITGERALDPAHFEFRGSPPRPIPRLRQRREDA